MVRFLSRQPRLGLTRRTARAAARWVARLSSREVRPSELRRFETWLDERPDHKAAFDAARATWLDIGHLEPEGDRTAPCASRPVKLRRAAPIAVAVMAAAGTAAMAADNWTRWTSDVSTDHVVRGLRLPDGSNAVLDAGSAIDVAYGPDERRIVVKRGRVWVCSKADALRPFVVEAQGLKARGSGQSYAVARTDAGPELTVTRGSVAAAGPGDSIAVLVESGRTRRYKNERVSEAGARDSTTAWREGRLIIEEKDLGAALAEIDRYRPGRIVAINLPAGRTVNAALFLNNLEPGLDGLVAAQNLKLHRLGVVTLVTADDRAWRAEPPGR